MSEPITLPAKVLLLEHDADAYADLLAFCERLGLIVLPCTALDAKAMLDRHKDLGGVLLAEDLPCEDGDAWALARNLHRVRPELPVFLRRTSDAPPPDSATGSIAQAWVSGDIDALEAAVNRWLFSLRYPPTLVSGIVELTRHSVASMFPYAEVTNDPPYVVRDRIIFGQLSTLIPLESHWCRGYMMLQCDERALRQGLMQGFSFEGAGGDLSFRDLTALMAEVTNLIWGAFKNQYAPPEAVAPVLVQVPVVINHEQKYISFGNEDPQLCLRWHLTDPRRPGLPPFTIVQRMIFNLWWSPEGFEELAAAPPLAGPTGVLELF